MITAHNTTSKIIGVNLHVSARTGISSRITSVVKIETSIQNKQRPAKGFEI